ncbi:GNAT family N-acetyltransferase [Albimonas pacifica]|uniref:N-acetyltransferase domain-containing protein n=1 Tax=Albimonas pacifica TaxID=1114924 RepID=A0A1I3F877_9RHOB|nr:GNAT family N-acetyltransferase [Albimonas pacifica]SFI07388.1 hypothetical protein SAMN05216258_104119 [Albimonas pacifica]
MPAAPRIAFRRLPEVAPAAILAQMSDPRVAAHLPLAPAAWDLAAVEALVAAKEACWARDGLGHWAILADGVYVGWGGFQKEGAEWDFGLVLTPEAFGLGLRIAARALVAARADPRIPFVTFLLPLSRRRLGALARLGARPLGVVDHAGVPFRKFRLETPAEGPPGTVA